MVQIFKGIESDESWLSIETTSFYNNRLKHHFSEKKARQRLCRKVPMRDYGHDGMIYKHTTDGWILYGTVTSGKFEFNLPNIIFAVDIQ